MSISGKSGTAQSKVAAMKECGIYMCENLGTLGEVVREGLFVSCKFQAVSCEL